MSALPSAALRTREFAFSAADHRAVADIVYATVGILLPPHKMQLVYGRLAPLARSHALGSIAEYVALTERDPAEREKMIDALTTNHTSFFREPHHFEDFADRLWPELSRRLASGGRVRLWSAACSSGEEPYSWMMAAMGRDRQTAQRWLRGDFRMLATDVSPTVLTAARAGRYTADVVRPVPAPLAETWLDADGTGSVVDPMLRQAIAFKPLNLLEPWPIKGMFDAICCRNVMIYFDEPTKARLQARLAERLVPGGTMYIGHSERLSDNVAPMFRYVGRTTFQKIAA